jgi:hypothetical protein
MMSKEDVKVTRLDECRHEIGLDLVLSEGDHQMFADRIHQIKEKGIVEGKRLLWIFAYLWILLGLFSIHKSFVLNEPNLLFHQGFAFINAWLLAKVMLTAEMFHVADNLKHKPLIYPILFKSAIFSAILMSFYIVEETLIGMWHGKTAAESIPDIGGGSLKGILVVGLVMFVVLIPFFALKEISRAIGDDNLYELFFVRRSSYLPPQS